MTDGQVKAAYAALADQYIAMFGSGEHVHADDLGLLRRHFAELAGQVVDVGCGPGHLTGYLHAMGVQVTGIDLVPEFIRHARAAYPATRFEVGSTEALGITQHGLAGVLAWYSLIHLTPTALDGALAKLRSATRRNGILVVGFVDGDEIAPFDHKVIGAHMWPVDEFARRLARAGFAEVERIQRPQDGATRPHAAIAALAV